MVVTTTKRRPNTKLIIRSATVEDLEGIYKLVEKVYPVMPPYPIDMLRGQINSYPEGHMVAVFNNTIVGYSASVRISGKKCLKPHTWREITGGGYGSTHDPEGDYLYGYEVCVDPEIRGYKIGQRFYNERKKIAAYLRLKGIAFAGRIPNLHKKMKEVGTVDKYLEMVQQKKIKDPVLGFQLRNGFEILGYFQNYLPYDKESMGYAVHLLWKNPAYIDEKSMVKSSRQLYVDKVRVATVQYAQRKIESFEEFSNIVGYFVEVTSEYKSDFVLFPEYITLQLLSIDNDEVPPHIAIEKMTSYTNKIKNLFQGLALKYNINIIAGSHPMIIDGKVMNISMIFLRDGSYHEQPKIHVTPDEAYWWNTQGGDKVKVIETDCGPIGVLICYDSEFPELTRHLVDQGMNILFVPYLTSERHGHSRVRYCCQARAVENQIYVVTAGNVGNLPKVHNMDIHYGQSCIITPCDFPFARDGIAAETTPNVEMVAFADLRLDSLLESRVSGTVRNLKDRRHDLYTVKWLNKE